MHSKYRSVEILVCDNFLSKIDKKLWKNVPTITVVDLLNFNRRRLIIPCGRYSKDIYDQLFINRYPLHYIFLPQDGILYGEVGNIEVDTDTLDNILQGRRVSFIKMDIEGAEFNAIEGARNTIKRYHPRMAISVYHKLEDILAIPNLILEICPEYKFALRHYQNQPNETILYAF